MRSKSGFSLFVCVLAATADARTVDDVIRRFGPAADVRLAPKFSTAGVPYPPKKAVLVVLKREKRFELWASGENGPPRFVRAYPILAASGGDGPKLREGDLQVPEGRYRITLLNPNSSYHLSMRIDYPSAFDREMARREKRSRLGGDIYIHGRDVSIGCVALGDEAIEELFVLAARIGLKNIELWIAPCDFRKGCDPPIPANHPWVRGAYQRLHRELRRLRP